MAEWLTVRTPEGPRVATSRAPFDPVTTDALVRAARRIRRGPDRTSAKAHHSVYVVLFQLPTGEYALYVGSTGHTPAERYQKHKAGYKSSKWVRKYGVGLLPALYRHLNPLDYKEAIAAEVALADALRQTGILVKQG